MKTYMLAMAIGGAILAAVVAPVLAAPSKLAIKVLSSDPARVSGGDALIEIADAGGVAPVVKLNGNDVSKAFAAGPHVALLTGLKLGANVVVATAGGQVASLTLTNHSVAGPVFAGPKEKPFYCDTTRFTLPDGTALPAAKEPDCSIETKVGYYYKAKDAKGFKPLPSMTALPADVAMTTTSLGQIVPYVVRLETGTIDRGIYQIAVLSDPTTDTAPSLTHPSKNWNQRFAYLHFGGCGGMYRQGPRMGSVGENGVLDDQFLGLGYMTIGNTLNVFANNCDDVLASEAAMMTREHAIKEMGLPLFTIGWGCSGGSHQVLQTADNYPGLFDGIMPLCDSVDYFRLLQQSADMTLVHDWLDQPAARTLTEDQKVAIDGALLESSLGSTRLLDPTVCPDVVPHDVAFNAKTNPKGVYCTQAEHTLNAMGRDPATGHGWLVFDNVGIQYGLAALQDHKITVAQFLDLNEQIGGLDAIGQHASKRSVADVKGLEAAYRTGRVLSGGGGLKDTPVLEQRNYSDRDKPAQHLKSATYATLARLDREAGNHDNYVVLLESHRNGEYAASRGGDDMSRYAIAKMDQWLTALVADTAPGSRREKVLRSKPVDLVDSCYDPEGQRIEEKQTFSGGRCNQLYPTHPTPRIVAGEPVAQDVLKCQLKPVDAADYKVPFTAAETARLKTVFPNGVCNWTKPGVGQGPLKGTWLSF